MGAPKIGTDGVECWYAQYWAQSWYRNTYLVNDPRQIARQRRDERDWNNLYDSGCNFVCVSTILQIEPARLASLLGERHFFKADRCIRARNIRGEAVSLVWDQNQPNTRRRQVRLRHVWDTVRQRYVTLALRFVAEDFTFDHDDGKRIVAMARRRGEHVICGARDHSHLVAGRTDGDFYLWDPDDTEIPVEDSLGGRLRLSHLFARYIDEPIEFWRYSVTRIVEAPRNSRARG